MNTENNYQATDLGNISPNPRGDYDASASYEYLDLVNMNGGSYICLAELGTTVTGVSPEPGKTTKVWQCVALPGDLTPEYIAMHDDVVNKAESVAEDTKNVTEMHENVAGMESNVQELQKQAAQSAGEAEASKDSAAGYARAADASRQAAEEAEANVNAQVTGFDSHVAEKTAEAEGAIVKARQAAVEVVSAATETATNAAERAGRAASTAEEAKTAAAGSETNAAASASAAKASETNAKASEEAAKAAMQATQDAAAGVAADREQIAANKEGITALKKNRSSAIVQTATGTSIVAQDSSDDPVRGLRVFGRTTQRKTTGAQLFDVNDIYILSPGYSIDQDDWITVEWDNSGNDATTFRNIYTRASENLQPNTTYLVIIEVDYVDTDLLIYAVSDTATDMRYISQFTSGFSIKNVGISIRTVSTVSSFDECTVMTRTFVLFPARTSGKAKFRISILADTTITADTFIYEPYTGGIPSPNPDCPQELVSVGDSGSVEVSITDGTEDNVQPLTIQTPNGLPGIPVNDESLANYTDESGQMWCSDEVDLERGVYVQRVQEVTFNGGFIVDGHGTFMNSVKPNGFKVGYDTQYTLIAVLCSHYEANTWIYVDTRHNNGCALGWGGYSIGIVDDSFTSVNDFNAYVAENPITVLYILATPIETPLTESELTAYQSLRSNYPVTTVLSSDNAHMEFSYNADPKNYVAAEHAKMEAAFDAKLAEIIALLPAETQAAMIDNETTNLLNESEE